MLQKLQCVLRRYPILSISFSRSLSPTRHPFHHYSCALVRKYLICERPCTFGPSEDDRGQSLFFFFNNARAFHTVRVKHDGMGGGVDDTASAHLCVFVPFYSPLSLTFRCSRNSFDYQDVTSATSHLTPALLCSLWFNWWWCIPQVVDTASGAYRKWCIPFQLLEYQICCGGGLI